MYPKEMKSVWRRYYSPMLIEALLIIVKIQKQPKSPTTDKVGFWATLRKPKASWKRAESL
jgi:hypothetical protein